MSYVAKLENTSDSYIFHKGGSFISNPGSVKLETISDLYIFHKGGNWRLI